MRTYKQERDAMWKKQFAEAVAGDELLWKPSFELRKLRQKDGGFDYYEYRTPGGADSRYYALSEELSSLQKDVLTDGARAEQLAAAAKDKRLSGLGNYFAIRKYRSLVQKDLQTLLSEGQKELVRVAYEHLCLLPEGTLDLLEGNRLVYDGLCGTVPASVRKKIEKDCEANRKEILSGMEEEPAEAPVEEEPEEIREISEEELDEAVVEDVQRELDEERAAAEAAAMKYEPESLSSKEPVLEEPAAEPEVPASSFPTFSGIRPKEEGGVYFVSTENVKEAAYQSYTAAVSASTMIRTPRAFAIEDPKEVFRCGDALLSCLWQPEMDKELLSDSGGGFLVVNTTEEENRHGVILVRFQKIIRNEYSTTFDLQIRDSVDAITGKRVCTATVFRPQRSEGPKRVKMNLDPSLSEAFFAPLDEKIAALIRPMEQVPATEPYSTQRRDDEPAYFRDRQ